MTDVFFLFGLAILQGLTEWLPVSSSAHLFLAEIFLHRHFDWSVLPQYFLSINIFLHFATMLSLCFFFRKDLFCFIKNMRLWCLILVADFPGAMVGFFFRDFISDSMKDFHWLAFFFLVTAGVLFFSRWWEIFRRRKRGQCKNENAPEKIKIIDEITFFDAFLIGLAQSFALFPGISRSAITISVALFRGFPGKIATVFSMLISAPLILGAFVFEAKNIRDLSYLNFYHIFFSGIITFFVSLFALRLLFMVVRRHKLHIFGYYLLLLSFLLLFVDIF